jgi:hypothetical protein
MLFDTMFFEDRYSAAIVRDDLIAATFFVREILAKGSSRTVLDREENPCFIQVGKASKSRA